jgi:hypothetical protein
LLAALPLLVALAIPRTGTAGGDTRQLLARIILVPGAPGGQIASPYVYPTEAVPPAAFDVYLDPELEGQALGDYLADRARLLACRYTVWLYRFDDEDALGKQGVPGPTLVIEPDNAGRFPLAGPAVVPGRLYAWQVVATLSAGGRQVQLWSAPLYFHTAPAEACLPEQLSAQTRITLEALSRLASEQERAEAALQASLRGLLPYSNYPSASDLFLCVPLVGDDTCPRLDPATGGHLSLPQLIALGRHAAQASALQSASQNGQPVTGELVQVGAGLYSTLQRWASDGSAPQSKEFAAVVDVANRLRSATPPPDAVQAQHWLSELQVATDALAGSGTVELRPGYEAGFLAYAAATRGRLEALAKLDLPGQKVLPAEEWAAWLALLDSAAASLQLVEQEVRRGRLGKSQLSARLQAAAAGMRLPESPAASYLEGAACRVDLSRIKRLTPADAPQLARLAAELARCHLLRLARALWPAVQ